MFSVHALISSILFPRSLSSLLLSFSASLKCLYAFLGSLCLCVLFVFCLRKPCSLPHRLAHPEEGGTKTVTLVCMFSLLWKLCMYGMNSWKWRRKTCGGGEDYGGGRCDCERSCVEGHGAENILLFCSLSCCGNSIGIFWAMVVWLLVWTVVVAGLYLRFNSICALLATCILYSVILLLCVSYL